MLLKPQSSLAHASVGWRDKINILVVYSTAWSAASESDFNYFLSFECISVAAAWWRPILLVSHLTPYSHGKFMLLWSRTFLFIPALDKPLARETKFWKFDYLRHRLLALCLLFLRFVLRRNRLPIEWFLVVFIMIQTDRVWCVFKKTAKLRADFSYYFEPTMGDVQDIWCIDWKINHLDSKKQKGWLLQLTESLNVCCLLTYNIQAYSHNFHFLNWYQCHVKAHRLFK